MDGYLYLEIDVLFAKIFVHMQILRRIASLLLITTFLLGAVSCIAWMDHTSGFMDHSMMAGTAHELSMTVAAASEINKAQSATCTDCDTVQQIFGAAAVVNPLATFFVSLGLSLLFVAFFYFDQVSFGSQKSRAPPWQLLHLHLVQRLRMQRAVVLLR